MTMVPSPVASISCARRNWHDRPILRDNSALTTFRLKIRLRYRHLLIIDMHSRDVGILSDAANGCRDKVDKPEAGGDTSARPSCSRNADDLLPIFGFVIGFSFSAHEMPWYSAGRWSPLANSRYLYSQ